MVATIDDEKRLVRQAVRAARKAMSHEEQISARDQLTRQLSALTARHNARRVTCYLPINGEPDTTGFLAWAHENDVEVLLPVSLEGHTLAWARSEMTPTAEGRHGIPEPTGERLGAEALDTVDLMLIPACSVDKEGMRLGWGLGYYDRALSDVAQKADAPPVYAIVHDADLRDRLPSEPHDVPVDGVVTPNSCQTFGR